jgi:hypothetical protein
MIINHKARWVFVLPPKTGSTTLSALLQSQAFQGVRYTTGHPRVIDQHWPWPPPEADGYKIFLSVRHPVARAVSQFRHYRWNHGTGHPAARSFAAWVERLPEPKLMPHPNWSFTCWRWLPDVLRPRLAGVVRCERLRDDLESLGLTHARFDVPRLRPGEGPVPALSEDVVAKIRQWGQEDLKRFGYDQGRQRDGGH